MVDTLTSPKFLTLDHLMCSQSGNIQDLAAYSGHPSPFIIGSEAEPDSSNRQHFVNPPSLPSDMGLRYMTVPTPDDVRFSPDTGPSHSPYSIDSNVPSSNSSSIFSNVYQPSLSGSSQYSSASSYYSPAPTNYSIPDIRPRLGSIGSFSTSGMAPPSRSPALPLIGSPGTTRDIYNSGTPQQLRRTSDLLSRSPSTSGTLRGVPLSPTSSGGFPTPAHMDGSQLGGSSQASPPLQPTQHLREFQTADGQSVRPDIISRIDKGFFMADGDWTCYRRNYFSLQCSYTLHPFLPTTPIQLVQPGGQLAHVYGFSISIAAVVDGYGGKAIDLVQHTPKRDKGPQGKPDRIILQPKTPNASLYGSSSADNSLGGFGPPYDQRMGQNPNGPALEHVFERIQFKQATANNGKRRAAQQYYHLLVELFADLGQQLPESQRWVKCAYRMSDQMVVRGRSPGHYQSERRGSNASSGPSGQGGGASYGGGVSRGSDMSMSGGSSMLPGGPYTAPYDTRHQYSGQSHVGQFELPVEPIMSGEEAKAIDEAEGYQYYPSVLNEGHLANTRTHTYSSMPSSSRYDDRANGGPYQLPSVGEYGSQSPRIKQEYGGGLSLPSLHSTGPSDAYGRNCGRFEGHPTSRGFYPIINYQNHEVDTS